MFVFPGTSLRLSYPLITTASRRRVHWGGGGGSIGLFPAWAIWDEKATSIVLLHRSRIAEKKQTQYVLRKPPCIKFNDNIQSQRLAFQSRVFQTSWSVYGHGHHSLTCSAGTCGHITNDAINPKSLLSWFIVHLKLKEIYTGRLLVPAFAPYIMDCIFSMAI
jgi:hypothetical protein